MLKKEEIEKIANLAKIKLSSAEVEEFSGQLSVVLDYFQKIRNYDFTKGKVLSEESISELRLDEVRGFFESDLKEQFSGRSGNLLKVKKVL
ncbi:hypothetical protein K8R66_04925 [bacterium]|nr:hypothetical protein [bacterium]